MNGILLIDKPLSWTSFDVVAKVRSIIKKETGQKIKIGHSGTLDPMASGLLLLLLGSYTKRASEFSNLDKEYHVIMRLGQTTTTGDQEGELTDISNRIPAVDELNSAFKSFTGKISQTPHPYSAIKVDGKRAYTLARSGNSAELKPRGITIYSLELEHYIYPDVQFIVRVSSGTYIRSLVEEIGKKLKTGAYTSYLRRTKIGKFDIESAVSLDNLEYSIIQKRLEQSV